MADDNQAIEQSVDEAEGIQQVVEPSEHVTASLDLIDFMLTEQFGDNTEVRS